MKAIVFPGQGAQRKGMGVELFVRYPQHVAQADALLGWSLHALCTDQAGKLVNTRYTQPALFMVSYLGYLEYLDRHGPPAMLAGHSIGEFAALAASGALSFADALQVVDCRARLMAEIENGAMAAVVGLDKEQAARLPIRFGLPGLEVANENSPTQTIFAGLAEEVDAFVEHCRGAGIRAVRLRVSGAFHSRHMRPAAQQFAGALRTVTFRVPAVPVVSNVTARPHDGSIAEVMAAHLNSPVRWMRSVQYMLDAGVTEFVEIGPMPVLTPMIDEIRAGHQPAAPQAVAVPWRAEFDALPELPETVPWAPLARDLFALYHSPGISAPRLLALWQRIRALLGEDNAGPFRIRVSACHPRELRRQLRGGLEYLLAHTGTAPPAPR